jgi:hypothetical protein
MNDQTKPTHFDRTGARRRLRDFCLIAGATPPKTMVDRHGAPTDELLAFCRETGLSLDWLFLGDTLPLVLSLHSDCQRSKLSHMSFTLLLTLLTKDERKEVYAHIQKLASERDIDAQPTVETGPTIAALFDEWRELERETLDDTTNEARMNELLERCYQIEEQAVTLPARTPLDVWRLIRMTTDENNETARVTADTVVRRAYVEAEA